MANPNEVDLMGNTALHVAVIHNQFHCAEELLKFEAVRIFFLLCIRFLSSMIKDKEQIVRLSMMPFLFRERSSED